MTQNVSSAVMSQRTEPDNSLDDFPTPPWATRALIEHVLDKSTLSTMTCLEPACGAGHMARTLKEYFKEVTASDVHDYGYGAIINYLSLLDVGSYDYVITNPPFRLAEEFFWRSFLHAARVGIALLERTVFLESVGRYERLFSYKPPTIVAQFVERVPMIKGRLDANATTATSYAWIVWRKDEINTGTRLMWIPPCRKILEHSSDYISLQEGGYSSEDKAFRQGQA